MRNEPNSSIAVSRWQTDLRPADYEMRKTNPIRPGLRRTRSGVGKGCETKPIRRQVVEGKEVMVNWSARRFRRNESTLLRQMRKTNPISPRGTGILPVNWNHGQDGDPKRDLPRLGTHAHATIPAGLSCETNPIRWRIAQNEPNFSIADCGL